MGKSSSQTIGYWYNVAYHAGLGIGPIDAFLEFRGGDKTAWAGNLTASGTITVNAPYLWGGEKDQGGIVGDVDVMFGEATQQPNAYLLSTFGSQVPAWRGLATLVFKGGKFGAMNPYPQKPAYKIKRITSGWDNDVCWYPEKANIDGGQGGGTTEVVINADLAMAGDVWIGPPTPGGAYIELDGFNPYDELVLKVIDGSYTAWSRWPDDSENNGLSWTCGVEVTSEDGTTAWYLDDPSYSSEHYFATASEAHAYAIAQPEGVFTGSTYYRIHFNDWQLNLNRGGLNLKVVKRSGYFLSMNPAHILYYARTQQDMGREPTTNMNDASFRAGADWYASQSFGLCTEYDPANESTDDFIARIEKVAGCSMSRSPVDGLWYLDIANGVYDLASLPILTDDDILDFSESPSLQDSAINSVSVQYFDPTQKESITTAPVQAMALIDAYGTIHQQLSYPEVPTGDLALRLADRDLRASVTPARTFQLTTTRLTYGWRVGTYFRLQSPKRGIADMVCILAEKSSGTLKSGAIKITASQDVYSLASVSFVDAETGVDTRPSQIPVAITLQEAFEAPYIEVCANLSRADLAALPSDVGYLMAVAADAAIPATSRDFTLSVSTGGTYASTANGDWCATATVVEATQAYIDTAFTLANGVGLSNVTPGMPALWGSEIVRVDSIDTATGAVTFGRACGDTVPAQHAAGERVWFYATAAAADTDEYTDGETVQVKLLTNTGTQQLDPSLATALPVTFASRAARPYPPAQVRINGQVAPASVTGAVSVTGVDRNRVQQADQLVDSEMAAVTAEAGTTYTVRYYVNGTLVHTDAGLATPSSTYTPTGAGIVRVEFESSRDGLASYQMHVREFSIGQPLLDETGAVVTTEDLQTIIMG